MVLSCRAYKACDDWSKSAQLDVEGKRPWGKAKEDLNGGGEEMSFVSRDAQD